MDETRMLGTDVPKSGSIPASDITENGATQRVYVDHASAPVRSGQSRSVSSSAVRKPQQRQVSRERAEIKAQQLTEQEIRRERTIIITLCVIALLLISAVAGVLVYITSGPSDDGLILKNVYAAGVPLGGLTKEQAKQALLNATSDTYSKQDMTVQVLDSTLVLSPDKTGASLDVNSVVKAAYNYGRTGTRAQQNQAKKNAASTPYTVSVIPYLNLNTDYIRSQINNLGVTYSTTLSQSTYEIQGVRPNIVPGKQDTSITHETLTIHIGTAEYGLNVNTLYQQIMEAYENNKFTVEGSCTEVPPKDLDCEAIYRQFCVAPIDATIDQATFDVSPETYGYGFTLEYLKTCVEAAEYGSVLELPLRFIKPELTADIISGDLFQDVLATFRSPISAEQDWNTNLTLVAQILNNYILQPGEEFSFNSIVEQPTVRRGFKSVATYVGTEIQNVVGAGICQVASNLYNCALLSDLEVTERYHHAYVPTYAEPGYDAEIIWGSMDLKFVNTTSDPIRIVVQIVDGYVEVSFIGTDERDYVIDIRHDIEKTWDPIELNHIMRPNNAGGYVDGDVLVTPITGYTVNTIVCRYDKSTGMVAEEVSLFKSSYEKRNSLVIKIEEEPVIIPPTETPTEPPTNPTDTPTEPQQPTTPPTDPTVPVEITP